MLEHLEHTVEKGLDQERISKGRANYDTGHCQAFKKKSMTKENEKIQ